MKLISTAMIVLLLGFAPAVMAADDDGGVDGIDDFVSSQAILQLAHRRGHQRAVR